MNQRVHQVLTLNTSNKIKTNLNGSMIRRGGGGLGCILPGIGRGGVLCGEVVEPLRVSLAVQSARLGVRVGQLRLRVSGQLCVVVRVEEGRG